MNAQQGRPTSHLPGCCRIDRHIVPLDCEVPNDDLKPIAPVRPSSQVDESAVDAAFRSVNEHFALFGSLHGQAVPIADTLLRDILRGAILTYLDAHSAPQAPVPPVDAS